MTPSPLAMNGCRYKDLESEDKAFLRSVIRAGLARVVDGRVQVRNPSDVGYSFGYELAVSGAPALVKDWWFARGL